jgi:hypothetical protein
MISRKDMLLDKAKNRTITQEESDELRKMLEQEARNAQVIGDIIGFFIIMGLLIFLYSLMKELFGQQQRTN